MSRALAALSLIVGFLALAVAPATAIVGGADAQTNEWPWQIGFLINDWGFLAGF